jgi:tyrosyl-tRNA synthetase
MLFMRVFARLVEFVWIRIGQRQHPFHAGSRKLAWASPIYRVLALAELAAVNLVSAAMSILQELDWRGLVADCTDRVELAKRTASGPVMLYCGFDPTADSLHVGHLMGQLMLRRFQLAGHHPIPLAGGATGQIGDPSGKTSERQLLTRDQINHNVACIKRQLSRILDFDGKTNPARLVDNATWIGQITFLDFLRDVGKHFSVNVMMQK